MDTTPELLLRRELWNRGYRYRKHLASLPGKPDIAFPAAKVAVFCDGDFWHGRNWQARRAKLARGSNPAYWIGKISRNIERDRENTNALEVQGWQVVRLWETDIKKDPAGTAELVIAALTARGLHPPSKG